MIRILFFVIALVCVVGCSKEVERGEGGFVYALRKDGVSFYLGATMHLLREEDGGGDPVYQEVMGEVARLVVEMDGSADFEAVQEEFQKGMPVVEQLTVEERAGLGRLLDAVGLDRERVSRLPGHAVAIYLVNRNYSAVGAARKYGMDERLRVMAKKRGVEVYPLETVMEQVRMFSGLSEETKVEMVRQLIREEGELQGRALGLFEAWRAADVEEFSGRIFDRIDALPELRDTVYAERNLQWVDRLEKVLVDGKPTFMVVGAAHLFGESGLLALLQGRGWEVERVDNKGLREGEGGA